jgi:tripartite-type tricarboxylate transporter receptor subunit TctC
LGLTGFNPGTWYGIIAPTGIPKPIIDRLSTELSRIVAKPEFREKLVAQGLAPFYLNSADFADLIKSDLARFGQITKASNIKLD